MSNSKIVFKSDSTAIRAVIDEIQRLAADDTGLAEQFAEFLKVSGEVIGVRVDDAGATSTGELRVFIEPTNALLDFVATMRAPTLSELPFNNKPIGLIANRLAAECHEFALSCGVPHLSIDGQLEFFHGIFADDFSDLIDVIHVPTINASSIGSIRFVISDVGYLRIAAAAKDRVVSAFDVEADV
jgi:hypothetical protein